MTDVAISLAANERLERLDPPVRERITRKHLGEVADDPGRHLEALRNTPHSKVRVGDYRVIVEWDRDADLLKVHDVDHRRNIYD